MVRKHMPFSFSAAKYMYTDLYYTSYKVIRNNNYDYKKAPKPAGLGPVRTSVLVTIKQNTGRHPLPRTKVTKQYKY